MTDRHAILVSPETSGIEHGMLRDFQSEIARLTGAVAVPLPPRSRLTKRFGLGTRYAPFRRIIRESGFSPRADVLWAVLMGPEDYSLDVFRRWDRDVGFKILYLFDTMERQLPSIRAVLRSVKWDLTITSFQGAVPFLEDETQRRWFAVPQGVKLDRFRPAPPKAIFPPATLCWLLHSPAGRPSSGPSITIAPWPHACSRSSAFRWF